MGRPREFDIEQALQVATELFWRKGYDATSVGELTSAIGITPPSFYFAFHTKEGLFRRVVERYQVTQRRLVEEALRCSTSSEIVEHLLTGFAELFTNPRHVPGCLILNSSLPVTEAHPFRKWFAEQRDSLRLQLRSRFAETARDTASLPRGTDADGLAQLVVAIVWGMAIEAQSGASRHALRHVVSAFVAMWRGQSASMSA